MRTHIFTALGLVFMMAATSIVSAQESTSIVTYQGRLTDAGQPVADGVYPMTFRIWDAANGGQLIEEIPLDTVSVQGGLFTATVPISSTSFNGEDRWWSVEFNGIEMSPRQLATAAPQAVVAQGLADRASARLLRINEGLGVNRTVVGMTTVDVGHAISVPPGMSDQFRLSLLLEPFSPTQSSVLLNGSIYHRQTNLPNVVGTSFFTIGGTYHNGQVNPVQLNAGDIRLRVNSVGPGNRISTAIAFSTVEDSFTNPVARESMVLAGNGSLWVRHNISAASITIRGGSDLAEPFSASPSSTVEAKPGMVLSIDSENQGALRVSTAAYDTAVAGVYSGGNGLPTGMLMGKEGCDLTAPGDDKIPLAMTGRVWVWCDADEHPIAPGDRLTTSPIPGHAMVATDRDRADGAVIGKAMTELKEGRGLVLVLVNLQ